MNKEIKLIHFILGLISIMGLMFLVIPSVLFDEIMGSTNIIVYFHIGIAWTENSIANYSFEAFILNTIPIILIIIGSIMILIGIIKSTKLELSTFAIINIIASILMIIGMFFTWIFPSLNYLIIYDRIYFSIGVGTVVYPLIFSIPAIYGIFILKNR